MKKNIKRGLALALALVISVDCLSFPVQAKSMSFSAVDVLAETTADESETEAEVPVETETEAVETESETETEAVKETEQATEKETAAETEAEPEEPVASAELANFEVKAEKINLGFSLTWEAVKDAVSYEVSYKEEKQNADPEEKEEIKTLDKQDTLKAEIKNLKENTVYLYQVTAYDAEGNAFAASAWTKSRAVVLPAAPTGFKVVNEECKFTITWAAIADSIAYEIYRYDPETKTYELRQTVTEPGYVVSGVEGNKKYQYAFKVVKKDTDGEKVRSGYSAIVTATPTLAMPAVAQNVKVKSGEHMGTVTWTAAKNASGYYVYLYNPATKTKKLAATTSSTKCELKGLDAANTYYVIVTTYRKKNGYTAVAADSKQVKFNVTTIVPAKVKGVKVTNGDCRVTLKWSSAKKASGYEIFRREKSTDKWVSVGTTKSTSFADKGIEGNKEYQYIVKAYRKVNDYTEYGKGSSVVKGKPKMYTPAVPKNLKAKAGDHSVILTWSKADKATGYSIFSYDPTTGEKTYVGATKNLTYTVTGLPKDEKAYFVINAYRNVDGWKTRSADATAVSAVPFELIPAAVKDLKAKNGDEEIVLTWPAAKDATGYKIFMINQETKEKEYVDATKQLTYTVKGLTNGTKYQFCVQSYRKNDPFITYSDYSAIVSGTPVIAPPAAPASLNITNSSAGNDLSWKAVPKANGYLVYKYIFSTGKYVLLGETTSTKYTEKNTGTKGKFKYMVKAYREDESGRYVSKDGVSKLIFGKSDTDAVNSAVHPIYYTARINQDTRLFETFSASQKCGTIKKGTKVTVLYRRTKRCKIKLPSGKICYVKTSALNYTSQHYTSKDYSTNQKETYVNMNGFSSKTNYLAWVSTYTQHVYVFKGKKNEWKLIKSMPCCTGMIAHATPLGVFSVYSKSKHHQYSAYTYYNNVTRFKDSNAFHERLRYNNGSIYDGRMGQPVSNGCIRLRDGDAKYIYNTLGKGTTVIVY